jgi:hypothetical protein
VSFNIFHAITSGISTLFTTGNPIAAGASAVGGLFGQDGSSSQSQVDPSQLESALAMQSDCFQNVNTLSSFAQSQSQTDNLLASLIDGDDSN